MKKVELLSPVGSFEGLLASINAGADAVYLAGSKFGARAYADNFTDEEIIEAIDTAHLFNVKVYITVNTLVKEKELNDLLAYLDLIFSRKPDGVIVQDLGVANIIHKRYPDIDIHISTQMSITSYEAVWALKSINITRIVPARELSLDEIKLIKEKTGIEIEAFIHGAMCYSYSGLCLFSSVLGGRSGNRGRCAQPCRLNYGYKKDNSLYPLSMKDMCTLSILPELIDSGIDSFKIEGRMKKPVYAAGVTSIYRKYIDRFYEGDFNIDKEDYDILTHLYIRSGISEGYYHKKNGKEMITLTSPAYSESNDEILKIIEDKYLKNKPSIPINVKAYFKTNEAFTLTLSYSDTVVTVTGDVVMPAKNAPITIDKLKEQISKTKDTYFILDNIDIDMCDNGFLPIKAINETRREALDLLKDKLIQDHACTC